MIRLYIKISLFTLITFILGIIGCKHEAPSEVTDKVPEECAWTIYTPYDWSHDGEPFHTDYITVYSDAAGAEMKENMGEIADKHFRQILNWFNFQDISDFIYPPDYSKIEIYLNINHTENINWAYWGGFIITIRSSKISGHWLNYTIYTARHELLHVFEFLIEGKYDLGTDVWFREGLAVYVGCMESTAFNTIDNKVELDAWISENQNASVNANPVKIHQHTDFPEGANIHNYYRIFELAVRYLVDENGLGKTSEDVLNLFYDIRNDTPFSSAFIDNFGISLESYENNFFSLAENYLEND
jgi:hypothetical protein